MKNTYLAVPLMLAFTSVLQAQSGKVLSQPEITVGAEYAIPVGAFRKGNGFYDAPGATFNYGIGGMIKYLHRFNNAYGVSLQSGAVRYHSNARLLAAPAQRLSFTAVPVTLGGYFRYQAFFAEPRLGLTWFADNRTAYQNASTTYGLQAGAYITRQVTLAAGYERWNRGGFAAGHLGVRLAYVFYAGKRALADTVRKERAITAVPVQWHYDTQSPYWQKHRTFTTWGWITAGVGIPLTLAGLVTAVASIENSRVKRGTYEWLMGSGAVLTVSSVPCFFFAHRYKKMARIVP